MLTITIDTTKYTITSEPTIEQWMSLMKYEFEEEQHWPHIIKAITGIPLDIIAQFTHEQTKLAVIMIATGVSSRKPMDIVDFNALTFGHWIDIEYYLSMGLEKSMRLILDRLDAQTDSAQEALWIIEKYTAWRENIYKQYSGLFSIEDPDTKELEANAPKQTPTQIAKAWYNILVDLSGESVLHIEAVTGLGIKEALNFMANRKERELTKQQQQREQKQRQQTNGIQRSSR